MYYHPNFFIIGAQKTGTTYLSVVLSKHKDICFSNPKELFFFDRNEDISPESYLRYLTTNFERDALRIGEGTTTYLQSATAAKRIKHFVIGSPKFIVCLRHPLLKAISFYVHNWRKDRYSDMTLLEASECRPSLSPLHTSLFPSSIRNWLDEFDGDLSRFLFLHQEDLSQDPLLFIRKATDFLEISPSRYITFNQVNKGIDYRLDRIAGKIVFKTGMANHPESRALEIPFDQLYELHSVLSKQADETADLINCDLAHWKQFPFEI
jgi:hypothetical protein